MAKKEKSGLDIIESPEALQEEFNKAEGFLKTNQKLFIIIGGIILAIVLGVVGYNYYTKSQDEDAQAAMFNAVYAFEADSLKQALNGTGGNEGLLAIADNYGGSNAGNLANFMAGAALVKQGKFDEAIEHLKSFSSSDLLIQGRAYVLIGDAYMEKKSTDDAISYYKKAAEYKPNKTFTPTYLMKLGNAYEVAKNNKEALAVYTEIVEKYPDTIEIGNAKKYKSKLEGIVGE
jgi:predicted negative regulator of RcsB-dependent stress response